MIARYCFNQSIRCYVITLIYWCKDLLINYLFTYYYYLLIIILYNLLTLFINLYQMSWQESTLVQRYTWPLQIVIELNRDKGLYDLFQKKID